jgi:transposase
MKMTVQKPKNLAELSKDELLQIIEKLTIQNNRLNHYLFGSRSERFVGDFVGQALLFNEPEELVEVEDKAVNDPKDDKTGSPKPRGKRKPLPPHLPRVENIVDLPDDQKKCKVHDVDLEKIGEERVEKLVIVPAKALVSVDIVLKYKCPCCETNIVEATRAPDPIPKSFASPGLLAYITIQKYEDHLPLARQEKIFQRVDIDLDRTTMARWMIRCKELSEPLLNLMHDDLINSPIIHADETTIQVLNEPNKTAQSKSYIWCLARNTDEPIVLYRYYDSRGRKAAEDLLLDYGGTVICDGYKVYENLRKTLSFTLAGCWAHVRRRFWEAEKFGKKSRLGDELSSATQGLQFIDSLYSIEKEVKSLGDEQILAARQGRSTLILEEFLDWLEEKSLTILPRSPTGKAIHYALGQWSKLQEFARDARIAIDNNFLESQIKHLAVGRKNWVFASVQAGAHASAGLYSLIATAKANGIDPFDYLSLIFKELPAATTHEKLESLLPYNARQSYQLRSYQPKK